MCVMLGLYLTFVALFKHIITLWGHGVVKVLPLEFRKESAKSHVEWWIGS